MRGKQDDCSTICKKIVQTGHPVFLRAIFISEEENVMKKDKRKKIFITSILMIVIVTSIMWIFLKINNKAVEIQASKSEFNTELEENEHMHIEEDINGEKVPVPNGYVGSRADGENEINAGYVIYEGEEEVTNDNVEEAQKTRNQYVWVPVPDISQFYGTDENGKKWGKLYTSNKIGFIALNWNEVNGIMTINDKTKGMEPEINTMYDTDSNLKNLNYIAEHAFLIELEKEFNKMLECVEKYKGFYIGRYETSNLSADDLKIVRGGANITGQSWHSLYKKCKDLRKQNDNIETSMIWGNQWDRTLMWINESANKTIEEIVNSTGWGNYNNSSFEYINSNGALVTKENGVNMLIPTGSSEYTKANNIYDLAGNAYEFTMETSTIYGRILRGGSAWYSGNVTSCSYRLIGMGKNPTYGCRAMLYIK